MLCFTNGLCLSPSQTLDGRPNVCSSRIGVLRHRPMLFVPIQCWGKRSFSTLRPISRALGHAPSVATPAQPAHVAVALLRFNTDPRLPLQHGVCILRCLSGYTPKREYPWSTELLEAIGVAYWLSAHRINRSFLVCWRLHVGGLRWRGCLCWRDINHVDRPDGNGQ